jgi:tetratricopeptide (TPR) repeat protein
LQNISGAIEEYKKAIEYPRTDTTGIAYYNLGMALKSEGGDAKAIENHIEMALNLGIDPTVSMIDKIIPLIFLTDYSKDSYLCLCSFHTATSD